METQMGGNVGQQNPFQLSSQGLNQGMNTLGFANSAAAVPATMNQYLNPYQDQVINSAVGRLRDRRSQDLNMVQGNAARAKAFGGARHGLVEAQMMNDYNRQEDELVGGMLHSGFDTAAGLGQNRINQLLQGGSAQIGAAPTAFGLGANILGMQNQAGQSERNIMQQILSQASGQTDQYINYPQSSLATALAGVQGNPLAAQGTQTQTMKPGLFQYLSLGAGLGSSYLGGKGG
jgi:hypothetical protein